MSTSSDQPQENELKLTPSDPIESEVQSETQAESEASDSVPVRSLSPEDAAALDAIMDRRTSPSQGPDLNLTSERGQRVADLLGVLNQFEDTHTNRTDVDDPFAGDVPADLTQRTMAHIAEQAQNARRRRQFAEQIELYGGENIPGDHSVSTVAGLTGFLGLSGLRQVVACAAIFLVATSLLLPALEHNRNDAQLRACQTNLAVSGQGLASFANDHDGKLPRRPQQAASVWFNTPDSNFVATPRGLTPIRPNSANLYQAVADGYIDIANLACPTNENATREFDPKANDWPSFDAVSYSYHNQFTPKALTHEDVPAGFAVLADKNPRVYWTRGRLVYDTSIPVTTASEVHASRGQNVLSIDGSAVWTIRPVSHRGINVDGEPDRLWLNEVSTSGKNVHNSFLVP